MVSQRVQAADANGLLDLLLVRQRLQNTWFVENVPAPWRSPVMHGAGDNDRARNSMSLARRAYLEGKKQKREKRSRDDVDLYPGTDDQRE